MFEIPYPHFLPYQRQHNLQSAVVFEDSKPLSDSGPIPINHQVMVVTDDQIILARGTSQEEVIVTCQPK